MPLSYIPVSPVTHRGAGWKRPSRYFFAAQDVVAPVVMAELSHLLTSMPLAFVHKSADAPFQLVAVQSLQSGLNVYVAPDGRWLGQYVPAFYRSYPFRMMPIEDTERTALCVDQGGGCFALAAEKSEQRLFTDDGELTESLASMRTFMEALEKNRRTTSACVAELAAQDVIVPWALHLSQGEKDAIGDPNVQPVRGLHRIDEARLKQLPAETLQALTQSGALSLAYAQLFSEQRMTHLSRRYQLHSEWQRHASANSAMETLFAEDEDDILDFGA
ncbi:SapC family protein [Halomonas sp. Bachu 37]|uniref:SapC family protein n=1 Tax=Halomonas kashgarensis TaxID=3084920 RepID=UPI003217B190